MNLSSSLPTAAQLQRLLPGAVTISILLALFHETASAMFGIWMRSETFAHAVLVPLISMWLIWRCRAELAQHKPQPALWALFLVALACLFWLAGALADVSAATQFALVFLVILTVPVVFGIALARVITFPLLFLLFSVPFGEFMVPAMMEWTADFTVLAVAMTGIPVYREGLQFVIPSGNWSVVEACSGVRYLMASFMVGSLFAYLNYRSNTRRAVFMLVSLVVPIVANWLRAYLIVMLGHFSGNKLAAGADHLVYGWVFFGIIIMIMFTIGSRWSEPETTVSPLTAAAAIESARHPSVARTWVAVFGLVATLVSTQLLMAFLDQRSSEAPVVMSLPETLPGGWSAAPVGAGVWEPKYKNPSATAHRVYRQGDQTVIAWVGFYRNQGADRKLVSSSNSLVGGQVPEWAVTTQGNAELDPVSLSDSVNVALLRQPVDPKMEPQTRLQVAYLYWVNGRFQSRASEAKIQLALGRLLGRGDDGAVLIFSSVQTGAQADPRSLHAFVAQQLPAFGLWLKAVSKSASP